MGREGNGRGKRGIREVERENRWKGGWEWEHEEEDEKEGKGGGGGAAETRGVWGGVNNPKDDKFR
jgi:hypothetical protein